MLWKLGTSWLFKSAIAAESASVLTIVAQIFEIGAQMLGCGRRPGLVVMWGNPLLGSVLTLARNNWRNFKGTRRRKIAEGPIDKMLSSKSNEKSKPPRQSSTLGPKEVSLEQLIVVYCSQLQEFMTLTETLICRVCKAHILDCELLSRAASRCVGFGSRMSSSPDGMTIVSIYREKCGPGS